MEGVRITGIDPQLSVKVLWQYFDDMIGSEVKDIYYPLLNNDAVVIFKNPSETTAILTRKHEKWHVLPLPNTVFSKQRVWVESDLSMLVQATGAYQDSLRNMGQVDIIVDSNTHELILTGQSYQIEWAWNYLSSLRDNQFHIARTLHAEASNSSSVKLSNGSAVPDYLSSNEKSHRGHSSSQSPHLSRETKHQSRGKTPADDPNDITSLRLEGLTSKHLESSPRSSPLFADTAAGIRRQQELDDEDALVRHLTALSMSEEQGRRHGQDARERRRRQDDANDTFNKFASLPASTSLAASREPSHHTELPHQSNSRSSKGLVSTLPSQSDIDRAEAAHKSERQFQSMDYRHLAEQDDYHGTLSGCQNLQVHFDRQKNSRDADDEKARGTYRVERGSSYLASSHGAGAELSPYELSSASVELSCKQFDLGKGIKLMIYVDDIIKTKTDAVVNAANWELKNIGGVAGALAKAAGPEMATECSKLYQKHGSLATAQVVKTKAYGKLSHLKCVIHTVGPIYIETDTERSVFELAQTFYNCLEFAEKQRFTSVTFPFISTGIFGMPIEHCILSMVTALKLFAEQRPSSLEEIHFINNDINVVCEAIIMMEQRLKMESVESTRQRLEEGKRKFGRYVFPYCQGGSLTSSHYDDEHYATWDSSLHSRHGVGGGDSNTNNSRLAAGRPGSDQPVDTKDLHSLPSFRAPSDPRQRSGSVDRSRTVTVGSSSAKTSQKTGGRDPSPRPQPRPRSNSLTLTGRSTSTSVRPSAPSLQVTTGGKHQPVIKKSLTGASNKTSSLAKKLVSKKSSTSAGRTADYSGNDTDSASAAGSEVDDSDRTCPICLEPLRHPRKLFCGHTFCTYCIERALAISPRCPRCQKVFGIPTGTQPKDGTMTFTYSRSSDLPGYKGFGTIIIKYTFPDGRQESCHPNPGKPYQGIHRTAYLPDTVEGGQVLKMLRKAFDHRLVFTIGVSATKGASDVITWNDIHHKTNKTGGPTNFGYPDSTYLGRVKDELAAKGITFP